MNEMLTGADRATALVRAAMELERGAAE